MAVKYQCFLYGTLLLHILKKVLINVPTLEAFLGFKPLGSPLLCWEGNEYLGFYYRTVHITNNFHRVKLLNKLFSHKFALRNSCYKTQLKKASSLTWPHWQWDDAALHQSHTWGSPYLQWPWHTPNQPSLEQHIELQLHRVPTGKYMLAYITHTEEQKEIDEQ